jgi:hypothetical protein
VLGHIERAAKCWSEGNDALAAIHLALTGLNALQDRGGAACRLFVADQLMKGGARPRAIFEAFGADAALIDAVEKQYNSEEPRVPPGSGDTSGRWTRLSFLAELTSTALEQLATLALRLLAPRLIRPFLRYGLLFIPSPNNMEVEGDIEGLPQGHYTLDRDQPGVVITYIDTNGEQQTVLARKSFDGSVRDQHGKLIGRILSSGGVVIDPAAISMASANDGPRLCPAPVKDNQGRSEEGGGERDKDYQDYVKAIVNPGMATPRDLTYQLSNPFRDGKAEKYDDCQHSTGMMIEVKRGYVGLLLFEKGQESTRVRWLDQSMRQIQAAGWRRVRWYFSTPQAAAFAEHLFKTEDKGRQDIDIVYLPFPGDDK